MINMHTANVSDLSEPQRLSYLADWCEENGDYALAAAWLQRAVALKQFSLNSDPLEIAEDYYNLGLLYLALDDDFNERRSLLKAFQYQDKHLGSRHPDTLETMALLHEMGVTTHGRDTSDCCSAQDPVPVKSVLINERRRTPVAG
jgi:hypothetical protein